LKLPNFFLVGAAKAGTTSFHHYLKQHPAIYLPENKENFFFSGIKKNTFTGAGSDYGQVVVENLEDYLKLFQNINNEKAVGEVCVAYLYFYENTIANIKKYLNESPKIIIILRDPAERAFSNYRHHVRDKIEDLSFEKAIRPEILRIRKENKSWWGFQYIDAGFYCNQVSAYFNAFDRKNVKICLYEDLEEDSIITMKDIYKFLEVDEDFIPNTAAKYNVGPTLRNESFDQFLTKYDHPAKRALRPIVLNIIGKRYTETLVNYFIYKNTFNIKPKTRKRLIEIYRSDILKLEALIDRDLSGWLK
jgi:hypothetical protein